MKNKYFPLITAFLILICLVPVNGGEMAKKKIMIPDFKTSTTPGREAVLLTERLIEVLSKNSAFEVQKEGRGADYLVLGNVRLNIETTKTQPPGVSGRLIVDIRVIDAKTEHLVYARKLRQKEVQAVDENELLDKLNDLGVCQIAPMIAETILPVTVSSVQGAYAYLNNAGGTTLERGMRLEVFIPSLPGVDLKTGEVTGDSEYSIGELKITQVTVERIEAQIQQFSAPIEPGAICRTIPECK